MKKFFQIVLGISLIMMALNARIKIEMGVSRTPIKNDETETDKDE